MTTAFESINSDSDSKHDFKIELLLMIGGGGSNEIRSLHDRDGENNRLSFLYHHHLITCTECTDVQGGPSALGKRYVDSKFEVAFSS